ncbi:hypothetical protein I4U23_011943 [Adineta vaga]|nr:hypothetical protein I4U23_011943 [Adineta vaga]
MNSSCAIFTYSIVLIAQLIIGLIPRDKSNEYVCIILSYFTSIAADAICYSYLVTAISQFFFNILYHQRYLLTFRVHWFIIFLSWCISSLLPLLLYFSGMYRTSSHQFILMLNISDTFEYASELHMCTVAFSLQSILYIYMATAIGIPFFTIIVIYRYIVLHTRRINVTTTNLMSTSTRDIRVLRNVLILIGILGTAGLPSFVLVVWNTVEPGEAPVFLYHICVLTVSFCTNVQIAFIFMMNKNIRTVFWNRLRRAFY